MRRCFHVDYYAAFLPANACVGERNGRKSLQNIKRSENLIWYIMNLRSLKCISKITFSEFFIRFPDKKSLICFLHIRITTLNSFVLSLKLLSLQFLIWSNVFISSTLKYLITLTSKMWWSWVAHTIWVRTLSTLWNGTKTIRNSSGKLIDVAGDRKSTIFLKDMRHWWKKLYRLGMSTGSPFIETILSSVASRHVALV